MHMRRGVVLCLRAVAPFKMLVVELDLLRRRLLLLMLLRRL